ncbi:hypothetical protein, partial [Enterobacter cloacae complex sp. 4DZ1-17B1]|uniref:hypothetical protein n=1 Tax=Enterobacter cloacae complex sp. 4DZ1-17B1 TaxID=2511991 RepID=UPI001CA4833A
MTLLDGKPQREVVIDKVHMPSAPLRASQAKWIDSIAMPKGKLRGSLLKCGQVSSMCLQAFESAGTLNVASVDLFVDCNRINFAMKPQRKMHFIL